MGGFGADAVNTRLRKDVQVTYSKQSQRMILLQLQDVASRAKVTATGSSGTGLRTSVDDACVWAAHPGALWHHSFLTSSRAIWAAPRQRPEHLACRVACGGWSTSCRRRGIQDVRCPCSLTERAGCTNVRGWWAPCAGQVCGRPCRGPGVATNAQGAAGEAAVLRGGVHLAFSVRACLGRVSLMRRRAFDLAEPGHDAAYGGAGRAVRVGDHSGLARGEGARHDAPPWSVHGYKCRCVRAH